MTAHLTIVDHPLVQHKLTLMREADTSTKSFRQLLREISLLLAYEVTRDLPMTTKRIDTPIEPMDAPTIEHPTQMAGGMLAVPDAPGLGLCPDEEALAACRAG